MGTSGERLNGQGILEPLHSGSRLRLGIMGGAFDPIHVAHLVTAEEARAQFDLDQVVFMPTGDPPHKRRHLAPAEFRYLMTEMATASHPRFSVSRLEIDRGDVDYTVDTLSHLAGVVPEGTKMFFITGADAVLEILTWKDPARVLQLATFIAATRPGYNLDKLSGLLEKLRREAVGFAPEARVKIMEIPALAISSSMIRERLAEGRGVKYLVPDAVAQLIDKSGVYASSGGRSAGRKARG